MTRRAVLRSSSRRTAIGWTVILGGPESANYSDEYLERGADVDRDRRGRADARRAAARHRHVRRPPRCTVCRHRVQRRGRAWSAHARAIKVPDIDSLPWPDREAIDHAAVRRHVAHASRRRQRQPDHRPRLPYKCTLVLSRCVRLLAPPAQPRRLWRRGAAHRRALPARSGVVRRRRVHHQPPLAAQYAR